MIEVVAIELGRAGYQEAGARTDDLVLDGPAPKKNQTNPPNEANKG
jgi:hypothetical protein